MIDKERKSQQKIQVTKADEIPGYRILQRLGSVRFIPDNNPHRGTLYPGAPTHINPFTHINPLGNFKVGEAKDYMQREAEKRGGNAVIDFHWVTEKIQVPVTTPGSTYRKPFSDSADPRNYVRSFDRIVQAPPSTRYTTKDRYVFYGQIVSIEVSDNKSHKIIITCPKCEKRLRIPSEQGKLMVSCPRCKNKCLWDPINEKNR